eukprot:gene156-3547_t
MEEIVHQLVDRSVCKEVLSQQAQTHHLLTETVQQLKISTKTAILRHEAVTTQFDRSAKMIAVAKEDLLVIHRSLR